MTCPDGDPLERLNRLWSQLMLALPRSGRRAEALAAYREVRVMRHTRVAGDPASELAPTHRDARASTYEPSTLNR